MAGCNEEQDQPSRFHDGGDGTPTSAVRIISPTGHSIFLRPPHELRAGRRAHHGLSQLASLPGLFAAGCLFGGEACFHRVEIRLNEGMKWGLAQISIDLIQRVSEPD